MIAFVCLIVFGVFGLLKSSDAYRLAVQQAVDNHAIIEALGQPVEPGFLMSGNIQLNGASGEANLAIPLSGPKGSGTLYAIATKSAGEWTYSRLEMVISGSGTRIDLLEPAAVGDL